MARGRTQGGWHGRQRLGSEWCKTVDALVLQGSFHALCARAGPCPGSIRDPDVLLTDNEEQGPSKTVSEQQEQVSGPVGRQK